MKLSRADEALMGGKTSFQFPMVVGSHVVGLTATPPPPPLSVRSRSDKGVCLPCHCQLRGDPWGSPMSITWLVAGREWLGKVVVW